MSKEVATTGHGSALVLSADQERWNEHQIAALRQMGLEDVPQGDLDVFMHVAQRTGLDPFAKQVHLIGRKSKRWDPQTRTETWETRYTIQTGIDGYRLTAARAAKRDGDVLEYLDTEWCGPDGEWVDAWVRPVPPAAARVTVVKNGRPFPGIAMYAEYVQTFTPRGGDPQPNSMWAKMPAGQLAKCAEALAIRKAYPLDFAALYTDDEMGQADNPSRPAAASAGGGLSAARARRRAVTVEQEQTPPEDAPLDPGSDLAAALFQALDTAGVSTSDRLAYIGEVVGRKITGGGAVTVGDARQVLAGLADEPVDGELMPDEDGAQ